MKKSERGELGTVIKVPIKEESTVQRLESN